MGRTWIVLIAVLLCAGCAQMGPTARDLVNDGSNTDHVLTYGMGYSQNRYSPLSQINKTNVKKLVPVWKKEFFADGEVWVEGEWDDNAPRAAGV